MKVSWETLRKPIESLLLPVGIEGGESVDMFVRDLEFMRAKRESELASMWTRDFS